jgi:pSer/pThr/pTyr-binding forkhead associated (FHA) protein
MQGNGSFRLIVRRGPQPNQTYDLNKDIVTVGRDITNDIVINDPEVSRHHLRFTRGAGGYTIEDLGSTNGTFVNGQRITGAKPLNNGDMIGLGETVTLGYEASRRPSEGAPEEGGGAQATMQSQSPQPEPSPSPYSQPERPSYAPSAQQPEEEQQPYSAPPQPAYASSSPPPQAPPSGGYYEEEYEEAAGNNTMRIFLIGCAVLLVFCCCVTIVSAFIIDQQCLWYDLPVFSQVLDAIGQEPPMSAPACRERYGASIITAMVQLYA